MAFPRLIDCRFENKRIVRSSFLYGFILIPYTLLVTKFMKFAMSVFHMGA